MSSFEIKLFGNTAMLPIILFGLQRLIYFWENYSSVWLLQTDSYFISLIGF